MCNLLRTLALFAIILRALGPAITCAQETQQVELELPASAGEGTGPHNGRVVLAFPATSPLTVTLTSNPAGQIIAPAAVEVAEGQSSADFAFTVVDDSAVNLTRSVTITPSAAGATGVPKSMTIFDNETPPTLRLTMPASVTEGATGASFGQLTLSFTVPVPVTFTFSSDPPGQVTIPATATIPAGAIGIAFTVRAVDDTVLDGDKTVTVTATSASFAPISAQTTAIDNELPALTMALPAMIVEGTTATGTISLSNPRPSLTTITLASSNPSTLQVPTSVSIPAGETAATFQVTAAEDTLVNLHRAVTISATATGVTGNTGAITVTDNEPAPTLTVTVPTTLSEGQTASNNGTISLSNPAAVAVTVSLTGNPANEVNLPATVSIPAGQLQVSFTATAVDDTRIDGDVLVTVTAAAGGLASASAAITTIDNETRNLTVTLPATVQEGANVSGTVALSGTLPVDLQVTLTSENPMELVVPSAVTIPAGQTQTSFQATAADNAARDGSRLINVVAMANTLIDANRSITIRDNDVASYQFGGVTDLISLSAPLSVVITPVDIEGRLIAGFSGAVNVGLVLPDGSVQPTTPATAPASSTGIWTSLALPSVAAEPLKLRAIDSNGYWGESQPFEQMRGMKLPAKGLAWDAARGLMYASVPGWAASPYANSVVAIDPVSMTVTASVPVGAQEPGQLEITSGGEFAYVALQATCRVGKIDLATMTLVTSFAVGSDPSIGALYVGDMCTVPGQPNVLVVAQHRSGSSVKNHRVAAYDNGVMRPTRTPDFSGITYLEPSADPTIFFGYNAQSGDFGFQRIKLNPDGMTIIDETGDVFSGFNVDIRSAGNRVYSGSGAGADGAVPERIGTFSAKGRVLADPAAQRIYYLEPRTNSLDFDKISAHDSESFSLVRRLTMPPTSVAENFLRWGAKGLAFRTDGEIVFVENSRLVPSGSQVDLSTSIAATPNPASAGAALVYTIITKNLGPAAATSVAIQATFGDNGEIQGTSASLGVPSTSGKTVTLLVPELAAEASAALTVTVIPQSSGTSTCIATATSDSVDASHANNMAAKLVAVGFQPKVDVINVLQIPATDALYDPLRNLIWTCIPGTSLAPLGRSIVAVDPRSGIISDPIPINADPIGKSMALSGNGRYLYVGLSDVSQAHRIDLSTAPFTSARIALGPGLFSGGKTARDIDVLDGDGTSFIIAGSDNIAAIYDGATRRPNRTNATVSRLERTADPAVFVGYDTGLNFETTKLSVSASGVSIAQSAMGLITGSSVDIRGGGSLVLSSSGKLIDSKTLTLKHDFALNGRPCQDLIYQRAYLVNGNMLHSFSTVDGSPTGVLPLGTTATGDWAQTCLRWGPDGFAILGGGKLYLARWSNAIPPELDHDGDGIKDVWAALHFGALSVDGKNDSDEDGIPDALEYFFGTPPLQPTPPPFHAQLTNNDEGRVILLTFPRRAGLPAGAYSYATSTDLLTWRNAANVTETVVSTEIIDGAQVETVNAAIPFGSAESAFVRLQWAMP